MRLLQKQAGSGSGGTINLQNLSYGFDNGGNVTGITDAINSGQALSFGYDWLNRLTSASSTAVGTGQYNHTYAYNAIGNITSNNGSSYSYSTTQPHAVTAAFGNSYGYDANGNQTGRTIGSTAYTQLFDYQNRLVEVKQGSTTIGAFVYDADGSRVVGTVGGTTTVYIAGMFEYQGGAMTSYYAGVNGPVALRRTGYTSNNGIFYMLDDHLRSTGVILNQNGTVSAQQYYYPFGGNRGGAFSPITTKRYTGQYHEAGLPGGEGLSYYQARWYDGQLGRFVSADTLVPNPADPQQLNRLAYVRNNPLRFIDPSGHYLFEDKDNTASYTPSQKAPTIQPTKQYTLTYDGESHPVPDKRWTKFSDFLTELVQRRYMENIRIVQIFRPPEEAHRYSTAYSIQQHRVDPQVLQDHPIDLDGNVWLKDGWRYGHYQSEQCVDEPALCAATMFNAGLKGAWSDFTCEGLYCYPMANLAHEGYPHGDPRRLPNNDSVPMSKHVIGMAIDIEGNWLINAWSREVDILAAEYGFSRPIANEHWHFELK